MNIKWKEKKNSLKPEIILNKIDKSIQVNEDGSISVDAFEYQNNIAALYSMISFPEQSIPIHNITLLQDAVSNVAKKAQVNKENTLKELQKLSKIENSKREFNYNILTSISIKYELPKEGLKIGSSTIKFSKFFPHEFASRSESLTHLSSEKLIEQNNYTKVIIGIKAKTETEAFIKALNDLDLLRAIFSLFANDGMILILTRNPPKPINKIRLGQFHTIHNEMGKNISPSRFWYEPNFLETIIYSLNDDKKITFEKNVAYIISQLQKCNYQDKIKKALLRYVRAFDENNYNTALIEVWGSLELLTASNESNKDSLSRRCSFLFAETDYHKQILEHIREYRNQNIHEGLKNDEVKHYCYQAQSYLMQLILFHLAEVDKFNTLDEANKFLDLSTDINELNKQKELIEKAINFRKGEEV